MATLAVCLVGTAVFAAFVGVVGMIIMAAIDDPFTRDTIQFVWQIVLLGLVVVAGVFGFAILYLYWWTRNF